MGIRMLVQKAIENSLRNQIQIAELEVINESGSHNVPPGSESHFKIVVISDDFIDMKLIARHRSINKILEKEIQIIHALTMHTYTTGEWLKKNGNSPQSPSCLGGGR
ncbi:MAG: BolA protein [Candidatus Azotimanducaceae bacterium]|jgi:BolA protein